MPKSWLRRCIGWPHKEGSACCASTSAVSITTYHLQRQLTVHMMCHEPRKPGLHQWGKAKALLSHVLQQGKAATLLELIVGHTQCSICHVHSLRIRSVIGVILHRHAHLHSLPCQEHGPWQQRASSGCLIA